MTLNINNYISGFSKFAKDLDTFKEYIPIIANKTVIKLTSN